MKKFNKAQLQAIHHGDGPMMVLAGPGSGKTTVLVNRVLYLTSELKVPEESILVITFTRAAAQEMEQRYLRERARALEKNKVTFGTFHSVFFSILKERLGYKNKSVASERQCMELMWQVICEDRFKGYGFTTDMAALMLSELGSRKNGIIHRDYPVQEELFVSIAMEYERRARRLGILDFDDMLIRFLGLLKKDGRLLSELRRRYRYIMVDEFQDINPVQYEIVKLIAEPRRNIFIVGDDDQSIYGFRGSDPSIMLNFPKDYPKLVSVTLSINYRSERCIVDASLRLIGYNKERYRKDLVPCPGHDLRGVGFVKQRSFQDEKKEAAYIVSEIRRGLREGRDLRDTAVLYRVHKASIPLKKELSAAGLSDCGIRLMTFHGAKGLEFDTVYIISANEGITPWKGAGYMELPEERRMFYVAMTRAKRELHIFNTKKLYSRTQIRSRYVHELSLFGRIGVLYGRAERWLSS